MKQTIKKFGIYSSLLLVILFTISFFFEDAMSYSTSEIYGYASIVIALSFVYFGIKHYRDHVNGGHVSFIKSLKIGILISLLASITFGLINVVYTEIINPDFTTEYYSHYVEQYRDALPAVEFEAKLEQLETEKEFFANPLIGFSIMALTVLIIGFIISLLSGLILQRKD